MTADGSQEAVGGLTLLMENIPLIENKLLTENTPLIENELLTENTPLTEQMIHHC